MNIPKNVKLTAELEQTTSVVTWRRMSAPECPSDPYPTPHATVLAYGMLDTECGDESYPYVLCQATWDGKKWVSSFTVNDNVHIRMINVLMWCEMPEVPLH